MEHAEQAMPLVVKVSPPEQVRRRRFGQQPRPDQTVVVVRHGRCGSALARATGDGLRLVTLEMRWPEEPDAPSRYRFQCRCGAKSVVRRDRLRVRFADAVRNGQREILLD